MAPWRVSSQPWYRSEARREDTIPRHTNSQNISTEQALPIAAERGAQADQGDEDGDFSGFDLLDRPRIQVGKLGEAFLRHAPRHALTTDAVAERLDGARCNGWTGHASSRRQCPFREHGAMGRKIATFRLRIGVGRRFSPAPAIL